VQAPSRDRRLFGGVTIPLSCNPGRQPTTAASRRISGADRTSYTPVTMPQPSASNPTLSVMQVLPSLEAGGVERGTVEMTQAITQAGGFALVASAGGRMVPQIERAGGHHATLKLMTKDPVNIWLNASPLHRLIKEHGIHLVHARSRAPGWSAYWAARRAQVPFITTWHGVYAENFPGKRLYNSVMARGERVIAISHFVAARLHALGVDEARIRIIPRGVDTTQFDPDRVGGDRIHKLAQAWRLPPGAPVIMLPGRLTRWKGAELLLRAVAALPQRDVFCVLVGAGRIGRELERQAEALGLAGRVRLAGQCDDMPAALMLADVVACPSLKPEPFGRTVIEAQAMSRPVIAANHGGAAETVIDGETGWRVPPGDVQALAEILAYALAMSVSDRAALGAAARLSVEAHYTTAAMQQATLAVYREVLR
jgi:glycosyltransferase involved in cell wall biosynthesis